MSDPNISHYEIRERLGEGGMGVVYLAHDPRLERSVAIKVLSEDLGRDESYRQRFLTEARSASALNHPNIITVYEIGRDQGRDFIAMEYVEGQTLQDLIETREPATTNELLDTGVQLASALAAAHCAGIIHRDLKPGNVVVTPEGRAKILDFGLAKRQVGLRRGAGDPGSGDLAVTQVVAQTEPGMILGTPGYMAPEKARGGADDHRSDIFSLGCILYALATGKAPFAGDTVVDVLHNVIHQDPEPLDVVRPDLPASLRAVVQRCLAKQPRDRYADAGDLEEALKEIQMEVSVGPVAAVPPSVSVPHRTRPRAVYVGAGAAVLVAIAAAIFFLRPDVGVATTTVLVEDEEGQQIRREIPTREYRKRLAVFPFAPAFDDSARAWLAYAPSNLLIQDLLQDYYLSFDLLAEYEFAESALKSGYPGGLGAPLSLKRRVAKDSGCSHFITGRIGAAGDSVWTEVEIYVTESGRREATFRQAGTDLFGLIDAVSVQVRRQLGVPEEHLREWPDLPVTDISTASLTALEAYCRALVAVYSRNDLPEMRRQLEAAVAEDPSYAWALWSLYFSYLFSGEGANPRIPEVIDALMTHIYRLPERLQFAVKANYFEYSGDPEKQLAVLEMWAKLYPDDNLAHQALVQMYWIRGQREEAFASLVRLLELEPENSDYLTQAANLHQQAGDLEVARTYLQKLVETAPDDPRALLALGQLMQVMGQHAEARSNLEKALVLDPKNLELQLALADVEFQLGHFDVSRETLEATLADPRSPNERVDAQRRLVGFFRDTGQIDRAIGVAGEALIEGRDQVAPLKLIVMQGQLATLYAIKGDRDQAVGISEDLRGRLTFPLTALASIFALGVYLELEDVELARQATDEIEKAIEEMRWEHLRPAWLETTGEIRELEEDFEAALESYQSWLELEPASADAHFHLARAQRELGRSAEALVSIDEALRQRPFGAKTLYEAALIEKQLGNDERASAHLERALEVWSAADPDYGPAVEARATLASWQPSN